MEQPNIELLKNENDLLFCHIAFLEGYILAKVGKDSLDLVRNEIVVRLTNLRNYQDVVKITIE